MDEKRAVPRRVDRHEAVVHLGQQRLGPTLRHELLSVCQARGSIRVFLERGRLSVGDGRLQHDGADPLAHGGRRRRQQLHDVLAARGVAHLVRLRLRRRLRLRLRLRVSPWSDPPPRRPQRRAWP